MARHTIREGGLFPRGKRRCPYCRGHGQGRHDRGRLRAAHLSLAENGSGYVATLRDGLATWLEQNEYESLRQMRGSMNIERIPDPKALSRAHYMHLLDSWGHNTAEND